MTPYILLGKKIPDDILHEYEIAKQFMRDLPEAGPDHSMTSRRHGGGIHGESPCYLWSCHGVCRGFSAISDGRWRVIDGFFIRTGHCHAWLYTERDEHKFILDLYPIAALGGPLLLEVGYHGSSWDEAYIEKSTFYNQAQRDAFDLEGRQAFEAYRSLGTSLNKACV